MAFPKVNVECRVWLYRFGPEEWAAYLDLPGQKVLSTDSDGDSTTLGYIPGEARQVEWEKLPDKAREIFEPALSNFGLSTQARGLHKLPDWLEHDIIGGYKIYKRRQKWSKNNFRVCREDGKELFKGSLEGCHQYIEDNL